MSDKEKTQAMPSDGLKGMPDGTNQPARLPDGKKAKGDAGSGGAYPADTSGGGEFRGGQSKPSYHGPGKLGEQKVGVRRNNRALQDQD